MKGLCVWEVIFPIGGFPGDSAVNNLPANARDARDIQSLGQEDSLEKEVVTHSSTLAWKISWTEKPRWGRKESDRTE